MSTPPRREAFTAVSNDQLYDTWASTYDTDGNVLQAVDDLELKGMLPDFVNAVSQRSAGAGEPSRILDFGCGTGRNTVKLLQADWEGGDSRVEVVGWDASDGMLAVAREKCSALATTTGRKVRLVDLQRKDFADPPAIAQEDHGAFDGIISTLVLEHLPLLVFFTTLATLLKPGGYLLVTNMHPEMGSTTKAGYKTESGERVKGDSYAHSVEASARAARDAGLEVIGKVKETAVDKTMVARGDVGERGKKWVGVRVWYGFLVRKRVV